ncbi:MAG TPA: fimbria/pilus outer membrane usher protein [Candidatus Acidoferrum sp.]|nr:fimbria/pilus outer membrane usher protein [Candidatus Acidoferrum sp.]
MRFAALALAFALLSATETPPRDPGGDLAYVEMIVNSQAHVEVLAAITDQDLLVQKSDLLAAHIAVGAAKVQRIAGFDFVSLQELKPALTYVFDASTLVLHVEAQASLLPTSTYNLGPHPEAPLQFLQASGAFVNYSLTASNSGPLGYSGQAGYNFPQVLLTSTAFSTGGLFRRGLTYLERDYRNDVMTATLGDAVVDTGTFGGNVDIAGVTVQRSFALNPYLLQFPAPVLSATVLTPSRAEIYVNGVLTNVINVSPGTFVFNNLPTVAGLNSTVVVLRDAFGNITNITSQNYSSLDLLRAGLTDFAVTAGVLRHNPFTIDDSYGGDAFLSRYSHGFTNNFTAGARAEAGPNVVSGGLSAVLAGTLGALGVAYGASRSGDVSDSALQINFEYQTERFGISASSTQTGANYANTSLLSSDDRALLSQNVSASIAFGRSGGISGEVGRGIDRDMGPSSFSSASLYQAVGSGVSISVTGLRSLARETVSRSLIAQVNLRTGPRSTLTLSAGNGVEGAQFSASPPGTFGTNYSGAINTDGSGLQDVRVVAQSGILELSSLRPSGGLPADQNAMISGSLVTGDGHVFFGRPISDGYTILEGAGSGADVQLNGQEAGMSSGGGYLLIPTVQSNADNRVIVDESGEAINQSLDRPVRDFSTRSFGGGILRFTSRRTEHVFFGTLRVDGSSDPTPVAFAPITLTFTGGEQTTQADGDGGFSFDSVPAGSYKGTANLRGLPCTFSITLPESQTFQVDLGTVYCQPLLP